MTFSSDILSDKHKVGYYLDFDGLEVYISTHKFSDPPWSLSGTYYDDLYGIPTGSANTLDRAQGVVQPGGFSLQVLASSRIESFFAIKGGTESRLEVAIDGSATGIVLQSGVATFANNTTVYIDRETLDVGTHFGSGVYISTVRGKFGSIVGQHSRGAIVSDYPRFMFSRRCSLVEVNLDTGSSQVIRTGLLAASPRFTNGKYHLEFVEVMKELNRPIYKGWESQPVESIEFIGSTVVVHVADARKWSTNADGFVRLDQSDGFEVYKLQKVNVSTASNTLTINLSDLVHSSFTNSLRERGLNTGDAEWSVKPVSVIEAEPWSAALQVILSDLGNGANDATYDVLPGVEAKIDTTTADIVPKRIGAAIPASWVDKTSFEDEEGLSPKQVFVIDEPMKLVDFISREILPRMGGYLKVTQSGVISFQKFSGHLSGTSLTTYTEDNDIILSSVTSINDETDVMANITIECNWDFDARKYRRKIRVQWLENSEIYGDEAKETKLFSRSLRVASAGPTGLSSPPIGEDDVATALDRMNARYKHGIHRIKFLVGWRYHALFVPGYKFQLTDARLPDHLGGSGITTVPFEVTSNNPVTDEGYIEVEAERLTVDKLLAVSAKVSSYTSGVATLSLTDFDTGTPGLDFGSDWTVRIYDASASPPYSVSETKTITATTATTVTVADTTFGIAANDIIVVENAANTGVSASNTGAEIQDHVFMVDQYGKIDNGGPTDRQGTVWA